MPNSREKRLLKSPGSPPLLYLEMGHVLTLAQQNPDHHVPSQITLCFCCQDKIQSNNTSFPRCLEPAEYREGAHLSTHTIDVKSHLVPTREATKTHTAVSCQTKVKLRAICSRNSESVFLKDRSQSRDPLTYGYLSCRSLKEDVSIEWGLLRAIPKEPEEGNRGWFDHIHHIHA